MVSENKLTTASSTIADYVYSEDAVGNITQIHDAVSSAYDRTFAYDDINRLVTANTGSSLWGTGSYTYDAMGNMTSSTIGSMERTFSYQGTTPKLAGGSYDGAGNENGGSAPYGPRNLLQRAGPVSFLYTWIEYKYDGRGVRIAARRRRGGTSAVQSSTYTPELNLLAQSDWHQFSLGFNGTEYIWFGGQPVAQFYTDERPPRYTFTDHLGTPILQTDPEASVVWRVEYEPYGSIFTYRTDPGDDQGQVLRFPGQEYDYISGLAYNIFRWYSADGGRYTQADPIGIAVSPNVYVYTGDRPIVLMDSNGLQARDTALTDLTPYQGCCDRALANGLFNNTTTPDTGGIVMCCSGVKVACAKKSGAAASGSASLQRAYSIALQCELEHENSHKIDLPLCECCNEYQAHFTKPGQRASSECVATTVETRCLQKAAQQCNGDPVCENALKYFAKTGPAQLRQTFGCK